MNEVEELLKLDFSSLPVAESPSSLTISTIAY